MRRSSAKISKTLRISEEAEQELKFISEMYDQSQATLIERLIHIFHARRVDSRMTEDERRRFRDGTIGPSEAQAIRKRRYDAAYQHVNTTGIAVGNGGSLDLDDDKTGDAEIARHDHRRRSALR